jgi:hypothetical protein
VKRTLALSSSVFRLVLNLYLFYYFLITSLLLLLFFYINSFFLLPCRCHVNVSFTLHYFSISISFLFLCPALLDLISLSPSLPLSTVSVCFNLSFQSELIRIGLEFAYFDSDLLMGAYDPNPGKDDLPSAPRAPPTVESVPSLSRPPGLRNMADRFADLSSDGHGDDDASTDNLVQVMKAVEDAETTIKQQV